MNDDRSKRDVASVFAGMAPTRSPDGLLDVVFLTTGRMRPRPRWLALIKEPPMRHSSRVAVGSPTFRLISVTALTILLLLASVAAVGIGARVLSADTLPAPFGPARTGPLVYSADGDIYLADADGSEPHVIVAGDTLDQDPYFSLEGTKLSFGRGFDGAQYLMVANADGSDAHQIIGPRDFWFEWLPGGRQVAVVQWPDGQGHLSILDVDTGHSIREFDLGSISPDWWVWPRPPEGRELVFRGRPEVGSEDVAMYAIGPDGSGLRTIGDPGTDVPDGPASFLDPSMSPDGSTIVYWNWEPAPRPRGEMGAFLHLRDLDTGEELPVPFGTDGGRPVFSPDGKSVLFEREIDDGQGQLFIGALDPSGTTESVGPGYALQEDHRFGFSPDGTHILLGQTGKTTLVDIATGTTTELAGYHGPEAGGWQRLAS